MLITILSTPRMKQLSPRYKNGPHMNNHNKLTVTDFTSLMDKCCMQAKKNIAEVLITYMYIMHCGVV